MINIGVLRTDTEYYKIREFLCSSVAKKTIRCNKECLASEFHGLTRNIIKSVNIRAYLLQKYRSVAKNNPMRK